jgi:hypothetical protein|tara:strand:- start:853 stop:1383 length:531 start_codon:yes stop_codon:yes gene_type:complete
MDSLKINKYKYVKNILSPDMVEFLSSWSLKNFNIGDVDVPLSSAYHSKNSEIFSHITHYLLPIMEKETNLKLRPIYSYNRVYMGGAELKKHTDRPQCEISASITLKYFYKDKNYKWPLCMGDTPVVIKSGDGVIYKGCEIPHWRPFFNQPTEYWHHQLFIHYVDLNGPYKEIEEEK